MSTSKRQRACKNRSLGGELALVCDRLVPSLAPESVPRIVGLIRRFGLFAAQAGDVDALAEISPELVELFVRSLDSAGGVPSVSTMRLRRSALRSAFRVGRDLGLVEGDPTVDVALPARPIVVARPLTDLEVQRCRRAALEDLHSTRLSVPWALGEATARTGEVPHMQVDDLDLASRRVWIHGSSNTEPRWGRLTCWGVTQLERHLHDHGDEPQSFLTASITTSTEGGSYSSYAIRDVLRRAGVANETRVRPGSLTAWAGLQVFQQNNKIEDAARALGMRSLDGAARLIGWDWTVDPSGAEELY